jgi:hypothetical protein
MAQAPPSSAGRRQWRCLCQIVIRPIYPNSLAKGRDCACADAGRRGASGGESARARARSATAAALRLRAGIGKRRKGREAADGRSGTAGARGRQREASGQPRLVFLFLFLISRIIYLPFGLRKDEGVGEAERTWHVGTVWGFRVYYLPL